VFFILKNIQAAHIKEAVAAAEVVVLAAPWSVTQAIIETAGDLTGKIVVDCTNPIAEGMQGLDWGLNTSAGEQVAAWAKGANVVKAFNMTGSGNMANPVYGDQKATMFICGDNLDAKQVVTHLAEELGFEVVDSGPISMSRYLEPLAVLWVSLAFMQGLGPNIAFKLLKR
jgi:predicted dinucleotide-binding enzyme